MRKAVIKYRLFGLLPISLRRNVPESFEEMDLKQLIFWTKNIHMKMDDYFAVEKNAEEEIKTTIKDEIALTSLLLFSLKSLLKMPNWLFWMMNHQQFHHWLFQDRICAFLFKPFTRKNNPVIKLGSFYGPNTIDRLTGFEFAFADAFFQKWIKTKQEEDLAVFLSHIYRKKTENYNPLQFDFKGDIREPYNNLTAKLRVKEIAQQPEETQILAALWYLNWRQSLPKTHKYLFDETKQKKANSDGNWLQVIINAGDGLHNYESVKQLPAVLILAQINKLCEQQHELEKKYEKS